MSSLRSERPLSSSAGRSWALVAILIVAAALRLYGIDFGLPALLDPDELIFIGGAHQLLASGNFNPGWFGHPATTTIYVVGLIAASVLGSGMVTGEFAGPEAFARAMFLDPGIVVLPTRIVMAGFGVACVALTARLARRLGGGRTSVLVAGAMMAVNPVHIAWSQVIRSDIMALAFLLLAALASLTVLERGGRRAHVLACLFTALAITSKWPFAVAFLSLAGALALRMQRGGGINPKTAPRLAMQWAASGVLVVAFVLAISPYLLLDYPTLLSNLQGEAKVAHLGQTQDGLWGNLVFYLSQPLWRGLGPVGAVLALAGLVLTRRNAAFWTVVGLPAAVILVIILSQAIAWDRWVLPLFPMLCITAGFAAERLFAALRSHPPIIRAAATLVFAAVLTGPPLAATYSAARERIVDDRRLATDWALAHLPAGASLMVEHFAFDLVDSPFPIVFPIGTAGCLDARKVLRGQINYKEVDSLRGGQSNLDYAAVPAAKQSSCRTDFAILTEHARYAAERERFPVGAERYRALIARGRVIARFHPARGEIGGRPEVIVLDLRTGRGVRAAKP